MSTLIIGALLSATLLGHVCIVAAPMDPGDHYPGMYTHYPGYHLPSGSVVPVGQHDATAFHASPYSHFGQYQSPGITPSSSHNAAPWGSQPEDEAILAWYSNHFDGNQESAEARTEAARLAHTGPSSSHSAAPWGSQPEDEAILAWYRNHFDGNQESAEARTEAARLAHTGPSSSHSAAPWGSQPEDEEVMSWINNDFEGNQVSVEHPAEAARLAQAQQQRTMNANPDAIPESLPEGDHYLPKFLMQRQHRGEEPHTFSRFLHFNPLKSYGMERGWVVYKESDRETRDRINSQVFGGKLKWVDLSATPMAWTDRRKQMPYWRPSRQLPFVRIPTRDGKNIMIHITDHNFGRYKSKNMPKDNHFKSFYIIWGIPEAGSKKRYYYGAGYISKEDMNVVDDHLRGMFDMVEQSHPRV